MSSSAQRNLSVILTLDPSAFVGGLRSAQTAFTAGMSALGATTQSFAKEIASSLNNIKSFEGMTKSVEALKNALGPAKTEAERLGNTFKKVQEDLSGVAQQLDKARTALTELRKTPVNLRTDEQRAQIEALKTSIERLKEQSNDLSLFSKTLQRDLTIAGGAASRLADQLTRESRGLEQLGTTLRAAGVDTNNLTEEQKRLEAQLARVTAAARERQRIDNARNLLGLGPTENVEREIARVVAAYERLRASGTLTATELAQAHTAMTSQIIALRDSSGGLVSSFSQVRNELVKLALAGAGLNAAVQAAISFETAMSDVRKVVDFETPKAFKEMRDQIIAMSREIPVTVNGLAAIAFAGGQMGIAAGSMREFTELVAKMSTAFVMAPNAAGEAVGKMMNVFALTVPQTKLLADAINHLGNNTNAVEKDIVEVMNRTGGMARVFGLANTETAALATTFLSMGLGPERAATAINALMRELATAPTQTTDFKAALLGLGITGEQMAEMIKAGPQKALIDLLTLISKLDNQTKMNTLVGLFGKQFSDEIVQVVNNMGKYNEILGLVANEASYAGSMQREFNERLKTTQAHLDLAKNAITEAGIALGNGFLPIIKLGADGVAGLAHGVSFLVNTFPTLSAAAVSTITVLAGFGALQMLWSVLRGGVIALGASMGGLAASAVSLVAPFAQVNSGWLAASLAAGVLANRTTAAAATVGAMTAPVIGLSGAIGLLTTAARTLMLTPLGIFLTAASVAAWAWSKATESTVKPLQDSAKAMGDARGATTEKIKALETLRSTLEFTKTGTKAHIEAEQKLAELLPGANISIDEQGRALARVGSAAKDNTATLKAYLATLKSEDQQSFALHLDMQARAFMAAKGEMTAYSDDLKNRYGFSSDQAASLTQRFFLKLDRLTGSYDSNIAKGAELRRQLGDTESGFKALIQEAISAGMSLDQLDKELARIRVDPAVRAQILEMFTSMTGSIDASKTASKDLNEQLKLTNATLAGPLISATNAVNGAIKAADEQIKKYDESLNKSRETLKTAVDDASKSWQAMASFAAQTHKQIASSAEESAAQQKLAVERSAAVFETSERDKLAKLTQITIEESQTRIREENRYLAEALRINDEEYRLKLANAERLKQDKTRIDEERLLSERRILEQSEQAYRTTIDKLIGEEKRLLEEAKRYRQANADFRMSLEDRLSRLAERGMTDKQKLWKTEERYEQELAKSKELLRQGDFDGARKHAEKAMDLAEKMADLEDSIRESQKKKSIDYYHHLTSSNESSGKEVVTATTGLIELTEKGFTSSQKKLKDASEIVIRANEQQADAAGRSANMMREQHEGLAQGLNNLGNKIGELNTKLDQDHKLIVTVDTEKVQAAAAEIDTLLEKKERVVKVRAELVDVAEVLKNVKENVANNLVAPVQQGFDQMKGTFESFKELFKTFDPTIKFDVTSAQSSIDSLREKFGTLQEKLNSLGEPRNIDINADIDTARQRIDEIKRQIEALPDSKTVTVNVVTKQGYAGGGMITPLAFARGGWVPGVGNEDSVPILAMPGEFMLNKRVVSRAPGLAEAFNAGNFPLMRELLLNGLPRYASGGFIAPRNSVPMPFLGTTYQHPERASFNQRDQPPQRIDIRINNEPVSRSYAIEDQVTALARGLERRLAARTQTGRSR
ncbi:Chromosome partition protein Smc [Candidatus Magnetaquicoccaceae bacterium FCR-1]|uniref:Chromosome partition protein Smc n=1 Tax=Candidatus Magnetaquiglobus chichijimensis TaxID=3141448 RepID=A0ABQ0C799_9PROT